MVILTEGCERQEHALVFFYSLASQVSFINLVDIRISAR